MGEVGRRVACSHSGLTLPLSIVAVRWLALALVMGCVLLLVLMRWCRYC